MEGKKLIESLQLIRFLSYGLASEPILFEPLNVLIGPNGSGKSNLLEAVALLRSLPTDVNLPFKTGGGFSQWSWKGSTTSQPIQINASILVGPFSPFKPVTHEIMLMGGFPGNAVYFPTEIIYEESGPIFQRLDRKSTLFLDKSENIPQGEGFTYSEDSNIYQSIVAQLKDIKNYRSITSLGQSYQSIRLYREWNFSRQSSARQPQPADLENDFLEENAGNLALVLNDLQHHSEIKRKIVSCLRRFNPSYEDVSVRVIGGTVQVFLHEQGIHEAISAIRVSDGTLQFLSLLAVLCHPKPPRLVCIEEPEKGLHPDVMPILAELLLDASQRTQLIVTTHSDALVSALSHVPEAVLICERDVQGTNLRRLDAENLSEWLEKYTLGDLWRMGELGGTI